MKTKTIIALAFMSLLIKDIPLQIPKITLVPSDIHENYKPLNLGGK